MLASRTVIHRLHTNGGTGSRFRFYFPMPAEFGLWRKGRPVDWTRDSDKRV